MPPHTDRLMETDATTLSRARALLEEGRDAVLATVVAVDGTAYRRPGAKMVLTRDGNGVGGVATPCLEAELAAAARTVLAEGRPRVESYTAATDEAVWGLATGCDGRVEILLEPIDQSLRPVVDAQERGEDVAVLTVLDSDDESLACGDRAVVRPGGGAQVVDGDSPPAWVTEEALDLATRLAERDRGTALELVREGRTLDLFVDGVAAPPELLVLGTGRDVRPVVHLASTAGFRVTVVGFRGAHATPERFPGAERVVSTSPTDLEDACDFDEETYVVVMTHNLVDDRLALEAVLGTPVPYVGLMGHRDRFEAILDAVDDEDALAESDLDRLHTPVGLDLGGGSPSQIALAIVAEVLAVRNDRDPVHLCERSGPVHERLSADTTDE